MAFAERLAQVMRIRDMEPKELAHASGISQRYVNALLSGERKSPSLDKAALLARALSVSLEYLAEAPEPEGVNLSPEEDELVRRYRRIRNPGLRKTALSTVLSLAEAGS